MLARVYERYVRPMHSVPDNVPKLEQLERGYGEFWFFIGDDCYRTQTSRSIVIFVKSRSEMPRLCL